MHGVESNSGPRRPKFPFQFICSAQSENRYNSVIVPAHCENPTLSTDSGIVPYNFRIAQGVFYRF